MIASFGDRATEDLFHNRRTHRVRQFPRELLDLALVKMDLLNGAASLLDLRSPPGNRLEALKGDLKGYHSIRINDQWRLVFRWEGNNVQDLMLKDYHK
jgi:proteic killer suppression protein